MTSTQEKLRSVDGVNIVNGEIHDGRIKLGVYFDKEPWTVAKIIGIATDRLYTVVRYETNERDGRGSHFMALWHDPDRELPNWADEVPDGIGDLMEKFGTDSRPA